MTEVTGISKLFSKNCAEILQQIFLLLPAESLHQARQVCHQWNDFILQSVWGSRSGLNTLHRRLHHNWLKEEPKVFSVDYTEEMFINPRHTAMAVASDCLVVGLSRVGQGGAKVIDLASQEIVGHLAHQDTNDREVDCVQITKTWIITSGKEKVVLWKRKTFEQMKVLNFPSPGSCIMDLCAIETEDGALYLSRYNHFDVGDLTLYQVGLDTGSLPHQLIYVKEDVFISGFGNTGDTPLLVSLVSHTIEGSFYEKFHIDEISDDGVNNRTTLEIDQDQKGRTSAVSLSPPYLVILTLDSQLENVGELTIAVTVWNIDTSTMLYSLQVDSVPQLNPFSHWSVLLRDRILTVSGPVHWSRPGTFYVFDGETIEDKNSVHKSKRKFEILSKGQSTILFNKFLGVSQHQDTITFVNFWM